MHVTIVVYMLVYMAHTCAYMLHPRAYMPHTRVYMLDCVHIHRTGVWGDAHQYANVSPGTMMLWYFCMVLYGTFLVRVAVTFEIVACMLGSVLSPACGKVSAEV